MRTIRGTLARFALATGMVVTLPAGVPASSVQAAPVAVEEPMPAVGGAGSAAQVQGCAIRPYRVTRRGAIRGSVRATNCRGWVVWYGMQVHRWHGWTRIAGRDAFAGSSGRRVYTIKACKKGTYNYRMYIGRRGGLPPAVMVRYSAPVRRHC